MKFLQVALAATLLAMPLVYTAAPVQAATAHNSQAGANGGTSNPNKPTGRHFKSMKRKKTM